MFRMTNRNDQLVQSQVFIGNPLYIGRAIVVLRSAQAMTCEELAASLQIDKSRVRLVEKGSTQLTYEEMIRISKLFNLSLFEFMNLAEELGTAWRSTSP